MRFFIISTIFILALITSVILSKPISMALFLGLILFTYDAIKKGYKIKDLGQMYKKGFKLVENLVIIFSLIGIITAAWRLSGTIPYLVYYGAKFINKNIFYLSCFLLNIVMSLLLGSVNGTITTMGVVLISLARANGASLLISTGAILSGSIFGDRISPVSSSAVLVGSLTETDLVENRKAMARTVVVPTIISALIFLLLSLFGSKKDVDINLLRDLKNQLNFSLVCILPAVIIFILAAFKLSTRKLLLASCAISIIVAIGYQDFSLGQVVKALIKGVQIPANTEAVARVLNGGGLISMLSTMVNVTISAIYYGIFEKTEFLKPLENIAKKLEKKLDYYKVFVLMAFVFSIIFCTQSIVVILLAQMYGEKIQADRKKFMLDLENVPILVPSLVPWNMAANIAFTIFEVPYKAIVYNIFPMAMIIYYGYYKKLKNTKTKTSII